MTKAYKLGYLAYKEGWSEYDNPYEDERQRKSWLDGWNSALTDSLMYGFDEFEFV